MRTIRSKTTRYHGTTVTTPTYINFEATETTNASSTTPVKNVTTSVKSTSSTMSTTSETPITISLSTPVFTTSSITRTSIIEGHENSTVVAMKNERSDGVPIPAIVVPVIMIVCVGFIVLFYVWRKRYLKNPNSTSTNHSATDQIDDYVREGNTNNDYGSLQHPSAQEHRYSTIKRTTVIGQRPIPCISFNNSNNESVVGNDSVKHSLSESDSVYEYVNYSHSALEDYTNAYSVRPKHRKTSDDYLHIF